MSAPAITLGNRIVPAAEIFGERAGVLDAELDSLAWDEDRMMAVTSEFLRYRLPKPDPQAAEAEKLVVQIRDESAIKTVNDLATRTGLGARTLQRIFREYVGASPKWVIRRFRLHELVEVMNSGERCDWSQVALELGYFDQAHLINDFKAIVGCSPAQYSK